MHNLRHARIELATQCIAYDLDRPLLGLTLSYHAAVAVAARLGAIPRRGRHSARHRGEPGTRARPTDIDWRSRARERLVAGGPRAGERAQYQMDRSGVSTA